MIFKTGNDTLAVPRGDTGWIIIRQRTSDGDAIVLNENDIITFGVKKTSSYRDENYLIKKEIKGNGTEEVVVQLTSEDTKLRPGSYVYDVEIKYGDGRVDTVVRAATIEIKATVVD